MKNQLPSSPVHVDMMKKNGSFHSDVAFAIMGEKEFLSFLKTNHALGESYAKEGYYMYSLMKLYGKSLIPTAYYSRNYPDLDGRASLCEGKYLIVSPCPRNDEDKLLYYNSKTKDGVIILTDDSPVESPVSSPVMCGQKRKLDSDDFLSETALE